MAVSVRPERVVLDEAVIRRMVETVRPFTMVPAESLMELGRQVAAVLADGLPGHFVECGVWRGGASFLMAGLLQQAGVQDRTVWLCDSFQGLPAPRPIDGPSARRYAERRGSPRYFDNCRASLEEVREAAASLGLADRVEFAQGWFDATLPAARARIGPIAILRIDADWHASVLTCLENLYDGVVEGGLVVFDDYYAYDGCAVALHEFLGQRRLAHRLEGFAIEGDGWDGYQALTFQKGPTTWRLMRRRWQARQDIAAALPAAAPYLMVDEQQLGLEGLPFPERGGVYDGPPTDDQHAIAELERRRAAGVRFLVVAWPAFWWLDFYAGFAAHLGRSARVLLHNDRVMIVDLGA